MKSFLFLAAILVSAASRGERLNIAIAPLQTRELSYPEFATYDIEIINRSGKPVGVSVVDPETNRQVKGFGLGPMANATLSVEGNHVLRLRNDGMKAITVYVDFVERKPDTYNPERAEMVSFTLHNSSLRSIPLIIPDVMNPNLSPLSNSGVALKRGQQIYFRRGKEEVLILTVDESVRPGDKIDVARLVRDVKKD